MDFQDAKASECPSVKIKIRIKRNDGSCFIVEVNKYGTIFSLKEAVFEKTGFLPEQQRLVFAGKVLNDEKTFSFYDICENSPVYLVPKKNSNTNTFSKQFNADTSVNIKPKPIQLLNRMISLLKKIPDIPTEDYTATFSEINDIIKNPVVQSFSRINEDAKQLIKDAQNIISNSERPMLQKTKYFIAKSKDFVFDQFDSTPEGFRILQSLVNENDESSRLSSRSCSSLLESTANSTNVVNNQNSSSENNEENKISNSNINANNHKTNIMYRPLISTRPLPKIWSDSQSNDNEEPITRVKLTRAPGMSFTLLMQSESSSENDDENNGKAFKFEPDPSSINLSSKISPSAIPAVQLQPKVKNKHSKKSVFQRAALRMSTPIVPVPQASSKVISVSTNKKSNEHSLNNKNESNYLSSSLMSSSAIINSDDISDLSQPSETKTPSNLKIPTIPKRIESNNISINRIFAKKQNSLISNSSTKLTNTQISDSSFDSDENIPFIKSKSYSNSNFSISLKLKYAEQLFTLKNMGFDDENTILQVLNETNGNVQLTAKILQNRSQ